MGTTSLDLRQRILACYDSEETTQAQVAKRFCVSLGLIKKLVAQRRHTGSIAPRHHLAGRRPKIVGAHKRQLRTLLAAKSDLTLREMRAALKVDCTLPAIHYVLLKMGLSYKKKRSAQANKTAPISPKRGGRGAGTKAASSLPSSSSSTSRAPRPT
jgi:transposase